MPTNFFSDVKAELFKKTGESGPFCLGIGFAAYLLSKEYFIIHEEVRYSFKFKSIRIIGCDMII